MKFKVEPTIGLALLLLSFYGFFGEDFKINFDPVIEGCEEKEEPKEEKQ